ncbi:unnamed protein product [Peniophora sp. CBMAI 1063]|nr:unnamed protein product [Peniophora sp. CBMAI 1063]
MPSGRLSIAVQDEDDVTQADLRSVYARLAAYSQRDSVPSSGFGAVEVRQSPSDIATIRAFRSSSTLTSTSWRPYPGNWHEGIAGTHPDLDIRLPWSDSLASALFSSLKDLTPAGLRVLSLNIPTADDLDRVVHRNIDTAVLRDVSVLQLNGMCGERVSRLLAVDSDGDAELQTFFPALRLVDVKSSEWQEVLGRSNFVDGRPLADTLDARLEAGFAIPAVYVRIKEPVQWLRDDPSSYMYGSAEKVLRQAERLETTPGVRLIGEEEIMYDLTL